jgi:DNA-binding transcriptional LysR family regulator
MPRPSSKPGDGLLVCEVVERKGTTTMEFQQLEMFASVVEEGGITRAAERVCRTAAAVSIALTKLEEEFGVTLLDRSDRHAPQLTPDGKLLYTYARRILELRQEATSALKDRAHRKRGKLRLGTHESTTLYLLPSLLQPFKAAFPDVNTEILCGTSERVLRALANETIDLALIGDAPDEPQFERHLIARDQLVLIVSPAHRLTRMKEVNVNDLANEFLIVQSAQSKLRQRLVQAFGDAGTPFNLGVENIAVEAIKRMVVENIGVGFVPRMCVEEEIRQGKLIAISVRGVRDDWDVWLVRRKDQKQSLPSLKFYELALEKAQPKKSFRPGSQSNSIGMPFTQRKTMHC